MSSRDYTREDRRVFRRKLHECSDALGRMVHDAVFADDRTPPRPLLGMEIEFGLVRSDMQPALASADVLTAIDEAAVFQTELGRFNIEMNAPPEPLSGEGTFELERNLRASLHIADARIHDHDAELVTIGMLPTLGLEHFTPRSITDNPRYRQLNDQIVAARGEDIELAIDGVPLQGSPTERLRVDCDSVVPEAACTSLQLHLRIAPEHFARHWNAAQAIAGVQVAIGANSPFLAGRALWHESRLPVFEQATDTRPPELANQGVRPRVWFGERWIDSVTELFDENARWFPALLPEITDEDPAAVLGAGGTPALGELAMHNGTVYRWNRPVYDVVDGVPHLRIENRVLPSGPTVIDMMANAVFFYGLQRGLVESETPIEERTSFDAASENLRTAAMFGMDARLYWPGSGRVGADELVLRTLLPIADAGLASLGLTARARDRYLAVIEGRCVTRRTGAAWQREQVAQRERAGESRDVALANMLRDYVSAMHDGSPVHTW